MGDMQTGRTKQPKGTRRTRLGRCSISGQIYHVIAATHDRVTHFSDFTRGRFVVKALMRVRSERIAATLAYVVMPDHLHWLMQLRGRMDLSSCVGNIKSYSARMLNEFTKSSGAVWQRGFFDNAIRSDGDLVALSRYIVANPLRAGLVEFIGDYPLWDAVWMHPSRSKERSNNRNPLRSNK
jgi:REP element-mobilizing transposase RayT